MTSPLLLSMLLAAGPATVHDFTARSIDGKQVALLQYRGKVLLIVNTASESGYTPQYQGLEELYQTYRGRGFEILALPKNGGPVTWNFNKFLVDPGGAVVAHLDSGVEPTSADLRKRIEELLPRR